jgi:ceramide glucosyltransferase
VPTTIVILGYASAAIALTGAIYAALASAFVWRFVRFGSNWAGAQVAQTNQAVTIFKPLHQGEPGLYENLETFFCLDYQAPVQLVFGVQSTTDPALLVVKALQSKYPLLNSTVVTNPAIYGANAKVCNLINMFPAALHDTLVLSDSDIAVPENWLKVVTGALNQPGVGLVTCHYTGKTVTGEQRLWSILSAMGRSYEFLPNAILADSLGFAAPCFGSTIAFKRQTLDEVGGFAAFADFLADDYEMGRAIRAKGYTAVLPPLSVKHIASEASVRELISHEMRWARTVRMINPLGYLGSFVTFGFPFALISNALLGFSFYSVCLLWVTLTTRLVLKYSVDEAFGANSGPYLLIPLRDLLSFAVFLSSLFGRTVHWRRARFEITASGRSIIAS